MSWVDSPRCGSLNGIAPCSQTGSPGWCCCQPRPSGLTTEASAACPDALGKLTRDLELVLGSKVVGLVRERTSKAVSAGLWWWLFGENGEPVDVELTVQMIRRYWAQTVSLFRQGAGRLR